MDHASAIAVYKAAVTGGGFDLEQLTFRGRNDDGSETTATWIAAANTNWSQLVDANFRVRFEVQEIGGTSGSSTAQLQYNKNGAGWNSVTGASSVVRSSASSNFSDGAATTNQLTGATGTFAAGTLDEGDGAVGSVSLAANGHTEWEFSVQIRSVDVVNGDTVQLRLTFGGDASPLYTQTPNVTVNEPGTGPPQPSHTLEISFSNPGAGSPTWTSFSSRLLSFELGGGRASELDQTDATTATYVLDNRDRALDPLNASSPHSPNVVPNRRIRHKITWNGVTYDAFLGYVDTWGPDWEGAFQTANVRATDGRKLLARANFDAANPDVTSYEDVLAFDSPSFLYPLDEPAGTKVVSRIKKKKGKTVINAWLPPPHIARTRRRVTIAALEGVSGPSGSYKNTPTLGVPGFIAGETGTCVDFTRNDSEYGRIPIEKEDLIDGNRLTVEAIFFADDITASNVQTIAAGPFVSAITQSAWRLNVDGSSKLRLSLEWTDGSTGASVSAATINESTLYHVAGTWDGTTIKTYINGSQDGGQTAISKILRPGSTDDYFYIGARAGAAATGADFWAGKLQWVAIYEEALSPERIAAHYDAISLGLDGATTGARISDLLELVGLWSTTSIQTGQRSMIPARTAGAQPLGMIDDAVTSEGLPARFFFTKGGVPKFLAANYRSSAPYNSPLYTFSLAGGSEIPYESVTFSDEDSYLYNRIRVTVEDGATSEAADTTSETKYGRSVLQLDLPHASQTDADNYASNLLSRFKDPMIRIQQFTLNSTAGTAAGAALLALQQGDSVRVKYAPMNGGTTIDQTSYVERYTLSQATAGAPLMATFDISPR
jgi:hypothetical protein